VEDNETLDERKKRLQEHKDKLIETRNAERKEELMRSTFSGIIKDEQNTSMILKNEK
jgi:hypothetical protein